MSDNTPNNNEDYLASENDISDKGLTVDSPSNRRENTRSRIAVIYIYAFFITIACTFLIGLIKCFQVKDYIDFLIAVSGILSGPLGFIIGYYFKASDNK